MSFTIPDKTRFACLALKKVSLVEDLSEPLDLGDGLWALFTPPFVVPQHWQKWLGSIQTRYFTDGNLFLLATHSLDKPDAPNHNLKQTVWSLFYAILMHGVPHYESGLLLTGEKPSPTVNVRSVSTLYAYYRPAKFKPAEIGEDMLRSAADAAAGLRTIYARQQDYRRLKRGFEDWIRAVREDEGSYRLHQFVRAVEAVVKPSTDQTREQFIERCELFAVGSDRALGELYDLRTCVEQVNDWREVLKPDGSPSDQEITGQKRAYQAELLASYVYRHILKTDDLRSIFISDDSIEEFWAKLGSERKQRWGKPIDLEAEAAKRFLSSD